MARRSSRGPRVGGRGNNSSARLPSAPPSNAFDDTWLRNIRETRSRFIDLTSVTDRRRWAPDKLRLTKATFERPLTTKGLSTRIVIVPEGHRLARHQTYGGRYSLDEVMSRRWERVYHPRQKGWREGQTQKGFHTDKWGTYVPITQGKTYRDLVSARVGFHMPWQVIVCVRRRRRREVIFAKGRAGKGGSFRKPNRNFWSEVRC